MINMPSDAPSGVCVLDKEWMESIVRCPMAVMNMWWPRSTWSGQQGTKKNFGTISWIDLNAKNQKWFMLELTNKLGAKYPTRYDAVITDADNTHHDFNKYKLPDNTILDPTHETTATVSIGCQQTHQTNSY